MRTPGVSRILSLRASTGGGTGGSYFSTENFSGWSVGTDIGLKF
jgi:hypothetical protein